MSEDAWDTDQVLSTAIFNMDMAHIEMHRRVGKATSVEAVRDAVWLVRELSLRLDGPVTTGERLLRDLLNRQGERSLAAAAGSRAKRADARFRLALTDNLELLDLMDGAYLID